MCGELADMCAFNVRFVDRRRAWRSFRPSTEFGFLRRVADRFPEFYAVAVAVNDPCESTIWILFESTCLLTALCFELCQQSVKIANAIIDHEVLFARTEIICLSRKHGPHREPHVGGVVPLSPKEVDTCCSSV